MRYLIHTYIYALLLLAIVGCSKESVGVVEDDVVEDSVTETVDDGVISFSSSSEVETRGSVVSGDNLTKFGVYSYYLPSDGSVDYKSTTPQYMYNTEVSFISSGDNSGTWEYSPLRYWPEHSTDALLFWAYAPYSADRSDIYIDVTNTNEAVIVYNSPSTMTETQDLVVAATYCTGDDWKETVTLDFDHMLTRVKFEFRNDLISSSVDDGDGTTSQDEDIEDEEETVYSMLVRSIRLINVRTISSYSITRNAESGEMVIDYCEDGDLSTGSITATAGGGGLEEIYVMNNSTDYDAYTDITTKGEYLFVDTNVISDDDKIWIEAEIEVYVYDEVKGENELSITNTVVEDITGIFKTMTSDNSYALQLSYKPIEGSALWVYSLGYWEDVYNKNDM